MSKQRNFIYNPSEKPKNQLIAEFVIRKDIFSKLFKDLNEASKDTPVQHYLIAGQRGMGKTTLLLRVQYAIEDDPTLSKFLIPIRFSEEQYNIGRLERLWEEAASMLESKNPEFVGLYDEMLKHEDNEDYERLCYEILANKLKEKKQRALLMIDNIGDLFEKFSKIQNHRLREVLMTSPSIQIIGSSARVLEHTFHYDKPFFEFFSEFKLNPITKKDSLNLLKALGEANGQLEKIEAIINNSPERIEALRRITGGVPRTMVLLYEIFVDHNNGNAFEDLQLLLDSVNSLYKHRMDELKPQQQQIIDALARAWEPISAAEVLDLSKLYRDDLQSNQISAQLKQLADNQVVEIVEGVGRKKTYRIRERFFNIWYLMRHGRKQSREEVLWLIKFLSAWCSQKELNEMVTKQIDCMRAGCYSENAAYYKTLALSDIEGVEEYQKITLISETAKFLKSKNKIDRVIDLEKLIDRKESSAIIKSAKEFLEKEDYEQAERLLLKANEKRNKAASFGLAILYSLKEDFEKAEKYYINAANNGFKEAVHGLALFYFSVKKDYEKAEKYLLLAVEGDNVDSMFDLALLYESIKKDYEKAEFYYLKATKRGHVKSMYNLGNLLLFKKKDHINAEIYYLQAIEKGNIDSLFNLALLYEQYRNNIEKAELLYQQAIAKGHVRSMIYLARLIHNKGGNSNEEEEYLLKAHNLEPQNFLCLISLVGLYIRKNETSKVLHWSQELFNLQTFYDDTELLMLIIDYLLSQEQYYFILKQFRKENSLLMKTAKPYYYALAYLLKDELPGEYEKAGDEIKETVDEIIQKHLKSGKDVKKNKKRRQ